MPSADQKTESPPGKAFIPALLDDAGLTPTEFRVYFAILRRGDCFESVPKIANRCRMHRDTVWAALKSLEARGAITKSPKPGHTTLFTALPVSFWAQPNGNEGPAETKGYPSKPGGTQPLTSATTQPEIRGSHPAETEGYKGNPIEGNPIKSFPAKEQRAQSAHTQGASALIIPGCDRWDGIPLPLSDVIAYGATLNIPEQKCREWFEHLKIFRTNNWKAGLRGKHKRDQEREIEEKFSKQGPGRGW